MLAAVCFENSKKGKDTRHLPNGKSGCVGTKCTLPMQEQRIEKNETSIKQWKLLVLCFGLHLCAFVIVAVAVVVVALRGDLKDKYFIVLILKF